MSYTPTEWKCGDVVTADALNKMEQGIANCGGGTSEPLVVNVSYDETSEGFIMDKTFGEIRTAFENGERIFVVDNQNRGNTHIKRYIVIGVTYEIISGDNPSAWGEVKANQTYYTSLGEEPYTLEALDATYPSYN